MRWKIWLLVMFPLSVVASSWNMSPRRRPGTIFPDQFFWDSLREYDPQRDVGRILAPQKPDRPQTAPKKRRKHRKMVNALIGLVAQHREPRVPHAPLTAPSARVEKRVRFGIDEQAHCPY